TKTDQRFDFPAEFAPRSPQTGFADRQPLKQPAPDCRRDTEPAHTGENPAHQNANSLTNQIRFNKRTGWQMVEARRLSAPRTGRAEHPDGVHFGAVRADWHIAPGTAQTGDSLTAAFTT